MYNVNRDCRDTIVRRFISRVGINNLDDIFALREADALSRGDKESIRDVKWLRGKIEKVLEIDSVFKIADLEIDGAEIMKLIGVESGPRIGEILKKLLEEVIENPNLNDRKKLAEFVIKEYKKNN